MQIIDFQKKGQSVRFFLGANKLTNYYGDDWDDTPYEHNAGTVYSQYVSGYSDVTFDFDDLVLEPCDNYGANSSYCKDDMRERRVPCIIVVPYSLAKDSYNDTFGYWLGHEGVKKYYFGDRMTAQHHGYPN